MTNWVVFDYGEVICTRTQAMPQLAATVGADPVEFERHYWAQRDAYDRGATDLEYWRAVAAPLGIQINQSLSDTLTEIDIAGWSRIDPASLALLTKLREGGAALALLSNAPVSFARFAEKQDWAGHFQVRLFSGDAKVAKPDPKIFQLLLSRLDARPEECVFFDDRQSNVDGARAVGLRAHRWQGIETARSVL